MFSLGLLKYKCKIDYSKEENNQTGKEVNEQQRKRESTEHRHFFC